MTTSIIVPWKGGCEHRERALKWVLPRLEAVADEVVIGECVDTWSKADAVADALPRTSGDVIAIVDADVHLRFPVWLTQSVDALMEHGWAVPHRNLYRWNEQATSQILAGELHSVTDLARPVYEGWLGGGAVVLSRALYKAVPLDRRYRNWGQEDESWALALTTLCGDPWRGESDMWHLWHPPAERRNLRWGSESSIALYEKYKAAENDPRKMRDVLREAK